MSTPAYDRAAFGELVRNVLRGRGSEEPLTPEQKKEREDLQRKSETLTYCVEPHERRRRG